MKTSTILILAGIAFALCGCSSAPVVGPEGGEFAGPAPAPPSAAASPAKGSP